MLYHLFQYLDRSYDLPGAGMFQYISFRSALAVILALLITITFGQGIIRFMQRRQIGEEIRNLGLEGQLQKRGTPTMGGVMILLAVLVPVLLFGRLDNIYIQLMIVSTVWLGLLGFLDDYIKVFRHNKEGLKGKFKIVGQVGITTNRVVMGTESVKTTQTTIPFVKNNEFDYAWFTGGNRVAHGFSTCWWRSSSSRPCRTAPISPTGSTDWFRASRHRSWWCWRSWPTFRAISSMPTTSISCISPVRANWWSSRLPSPAH